MTITSPILLALPTQLLKMCVRLFRMLFQMTHAHRVPVKKIPIVRMGIDAVLPVALLHVFMKFNQPHVIHLTFIFVQDIDLQ